MITKEIVREVSRQTGITRAEATDHVERVVRDILQKLNKGESAKLPGLGKLVVGQGGRIRFHKERS